MPVGTVWLPVRSSENPDVCVQTVSSGLMVEALDSSQDFVQRWSAGHCAEKAPTQEDSGGTKLTRSREGEKEMHPGPQHLLTW